MAITKAFGAAPEKESWQRLRDWAAPRGLLEDSDRHPVFGFNNPPPSSDRKEYGYEFWIRVDPAMEPEEEIAVKDFEGGLYAVTTCTNLSKVGEIWMDLWKTVQSGEFPYEWRPGTHELEKHRTPLAPPEQLVLDLYLPIQQKS